VTTRRQQAVAVACLAAAVLAGCGTKSATQAAHSASSVTPALATSAEYPGGTWAVLVMGGSSAENNDFWQVFVRPAKAAAWQLATPPGAASNGGIAVAAPGGPSLAAAVRPSQKLAFSPLSLSPDNGARWAQDGLLDSPLAGSPDALAAAPDGALIALTKASDIEVSAHSGAGWTRLASERSVAASAAGRGCRLTGLTATAYSPSGAPLVAGTCARAGRVGIFESGAGGWSAVGPVLPGTLARQPVEVLEMARSGSADAALLLVGSGRAASLLCAWSSGAGNRWSLSAPYRLGGSRLRSAAFAGDAAGVLLDGGRAISVAGPGAAWRVLPTLPSPVSSLPAGGVTLGADPAGGFQALTGRGGQLSVWTQASGGRGGWHRSQVVKVAIPYGSSG